MEKVNPIPNKSVTVPLANQLTTASTRELPAHDSNFSPSSSVNTSLIDIEPHTASLELKCRSTISTAGINDKASFAEKICTREITESCEDDLVACTIPNKATKKEATFNLSSEAGQEHLRELNQELKALNEQGSPKLSLLHGQADQVALLQRRNKQRKRRIRVLHKNSNAVESRSSVTIKKRNLKRKLAGILEKPKSCDTRDNNIHSDETTRTVPMESDENEMDRMLEETAMKTNLTAINVKNILKYVVTNEHVLSMVKNSIQDEEAVVDCNLPEAVYEPKLTRSKAKELIQKRATVPWPISPLKKDSPSKAKNLNELSFSESESSSDEEYDPEKDKVSCGELPVDCEDSFNASHSELESTNLLIVESPTPPVTQDGSLEVAHSQDSTHESEDTIALRTRSKLPLNDTPLECIEAQFIAPDITTDMYDSECDDEEWKSFLWEFLKPLDSSTVDDDASDPEYNFLAEEDIPDVEDFRDDRAVKITKKEMQELVAELIEAAEDELADADDDEEGINCNHSKRVEEMNEKLREDICTDFQYKKPDVLFSDTMREQFDEQMRKHVQLLTQMYLFSSQIQGLQVENEMSKIFLLELDSLAAKNSSCYSRPSAFAAYNLKEAVSIVNSYNNTIAPESSPECSRKRRKSIRKPYEEIIANSKVFMYPEILPKCNFQPPSRYKGIFTEAEDNLLAMGLEQFLPLTSRKPMSTCWSLIKEHMLPVKSTKQIAIRIKNLKSSKWPANSVKIIESRQGLSHAIKRRPPIKPLLALPTEQGSVVNACPLKIAPIAIETTSQQIYSIEMQSSMQDQNSHNITSLPRNKIVIDAVLKTPEKIEPKNQASASILPGPVNSHQGKLLSPWKQVSPILKKYRPKQLRKTGGNLTKSLPMPCLKELDGVATISQQRVLPSGTKLRLLAPKPKKVAMFTLMPNNKQHKPRLLPKLVPAKSLEAVDKGVHDAVSAISELENLPPNMPPNSKDVTIEPMHLQSVEVKSKSDFEHNENESGNQCITNEEESVQEIPVKYLQVSDPHGSESDIETEMFDDGEDTADDDVVDMQTGDNEDDLAALMAASTTIKSTPRQRHNMMKKNKKLVQDRKDLLAMLSYDKMESDKLKEEREAAYAQAYLLKVKDAIGPNEDTFEEFLRILHEFSQNDKNVIQLYKDICNLLKDFPDLSEEFVAFLLPEQALECGKFMEFLSLSKMQIFLKKLEVHFGKHPHHIQKIIKVLTHLQTQENLSIEDVKAGILPMLRGQQHLIEEFLLLFPNEAPPESYMTDFEELFIPGEGDEVIRDGDGFEVIDLPDVSDGYGGQDCICSCHVSSEKPKLQNRSHHCMGCGIKFIDGRIFLQAGKTLKPCQVVYLSAEGKPIQEKDALSRICEKTATKVQIPASNDISESPNTQVKTSPASPSYILSPNISKDSCDERETKGRPDRHASEDIAKESSQQKCVSKLNNPLLEALEHISKSNNATLNSPLPSDAVTEDAILTPDISTNLDPTAPADFSLLRHVICPENQKTFLELEFHQSQLKSDTTAVVTLNEKLDDFKLQKTKQRQYPLQEPHLSSDMPNALNACTPAREDSQLTSAVPARNHTINEEGQVVVLWTRESDRILLQTCQQLSPNMETFSIIASKLMKSVEEVAARFQALMALYSQE